MRVLVVEDHAAGGRVDRSDARGAQVRRQRRGATAKRGSIICCAAATTPRSSTCGLPGMDGFALARAARAEGVQTPILMLTARDAVEDRVAGLNCGADDYLVKPFVEEELIARICARFFAAPSARCSASSKPERCASISPLAAVTLRRQAGGPGSDGVSLAGVSGAQRRHRALARADRRAHLGLRFRRLEQHRRRLRQPASPQARRAGRERSHRDRVGYRIPPTRRDRSRGGPLPRPFSSASCSRSARARTRSWPASTRRCSRPRWARPKAQQRARDRHAPRRSSRSPLIDAPLVAIVAIASYVLARATIAPLEAARERERLFAADAAHELRSPLTAIAAIAQAARTERQPREPRGVRSDRAQRARSVGRRHRFVDARARSGAARAALRAGRPGGDRHAYVARHAAGCATRAAFGSSVSAASAIVDGDERRLRELVAQPARERDSSRTRERAHRFAPKRPHRAKSSSTTTATASHPPSASASSNASIGAPTTVRARASASRSCAGSRARTTAP